MDLNQPQWQEVGQQAKAYAATLRGAMYRQVYWHIYEMLHTDARTNATHPRGDPHIILIPATAPEYTRCPIILCTGVVHHSVNGLFRLLIEIATKL